MIIERDQIIYDGVYDKKVTNYGTIKGGEFLAEVDSFEGSIEGGIFKAEVLNCSESIIKGGEFYNALINFNYIENAILKTGTSITNTANTRINKLTIDGIIKLDDKILNATSSLEMRRGSTLELDSMSDMSEFKKFINTKNSKINGKDFIIKINGKDFIIKDGVYENHDTINSGYFNMPVINEKDGIINDAHIIAKNIYNSGTIKNGSFTGTLHNENGNILGGKPDYVELISGRIDNVIIYDGLLIKGGSVGHITLYGGDEGLRISTLLEIKNQAGVQIEKLDIQGYVKLDTKELNNVKAVELLYGFGKTTLYLDALPDFSKITGKGSIKAGNANYKVNGDNIVAQNQHVPMLNDSFKLGMALEKVKELRLVI